MYGKLMPSTVGIYIRDSTWIPDKESRGGSVANGKTDLSQGENVIGWGSKGRLVIGRADSLLQVHVGITVYISTATKVPTTHWASV